MRPPRLALLMLLTTACGAPCQQAQGQAAPPLEAAATADKTATPEASAAVPPRAPADEASGRVKEGSNDEGSGACDRYADPIRRGELPAVVDEASGLTSSRWSDDRLWVHNDSGDSARLFALDRSGKLLATVTLEGAKSKDWEDIARGPCAPGEAARSCLYVADMGDNREKRNDVRFYRFAEPERLEAEMTVKAFETMELRYPVGPLNAEAIWVDEQARVVIFSKEEDRTRIFVQPFATGAPVVAALVGERKLPGGNLFVRELVTAADYDAATRRVAFRTYHHAYEWRLPAGAGAEQLAGLEPVVLPLALEPQGEAIAYLPGGLVTTSETAGSPLFYYDCRP